MITNVRHSSSVVLVELAQLVPYRLEAVYFDHRSYQAFYEQYDGMFADHEFDSDGETIWELLGDSGEPMPRPMTPDEQEISDDIAGIFQ